jgi:hypothetical protein
LICGSHPCHAHHLRIGLRTMGVRVSDHLTVPLCSSHHDELHRGKEETFWAMKGVNPLRWIEEFHGEENNYPMGR